MFLNYEDTIQKQTTKQQPLHPFCLKQTYNIWKTEAYTSLSFWFRYVCCWLVWFGF